MLNELELKGHYSSYNDDILHDFYIPVLERAVSYDRVTGFFSPKILALSARGFAGLIKNGGSIRLITSVKVDSETYAVLADRQDGLMRTGDVTLNLDMSELKSKLEADYLSMFGYLLRQGILQLKIALINDGTGILHEKRGIIHDGSGQAISFSGSNNETVYGWTHNAEEFKVFKNWSISTSEFFSADEQSFERLWNNESEGITVLGVDEALRNNITSIIAPGRVEIRELLKVVERKELEAATLDSTNDVRELFDYQLEAIKHWEDHGYKSIFEMATGTGKTFTSIKALEKFQSDNSYLHAVVGVPLVTLVEQWSSDLAKVLKDVIIINTNTSDWRIKLNNVKLSRSFGSAINYIIVTTYDTFGADEFLESMVSLDSDIILVADEMHNIVTERLLKAASLPAFHYKLGLSATPTRLWKPEESSVSAAIFGDNRYTYELSKAIENGYLVPYDYHPVPVYMTVEEYEEYSLLSKEIARLSFMQKEGNLSESYTSKLIRRARIKKGAENKLLALTNIVHTFLQANKFNDSLIYVDTNKALSEVQAFLTKQGVRTTRFTGSESLDVRLRAIDNLRRKNISAIVAIKCLDEGVDIPSATNSFFLANNTDAREYVQRLGRVLRLDRPGKKERAEVFDFIVLPPKDILREDVVARNLVKNELIRVKFFESLALNDEMIRSEVGDISDQYGFYFTDEELQYSGKQQEG